MSSTSRVPLGRRAPAAAARSRPVSMIEPGFSGVMLPAQDTATSKAAKRRSLLPQLSRGGFTEEGNERRSLATPEGSVGSAEEDKTEADRRAMPPPSKLSRLSSVRAPGTSQIGRTASVRTHTRTPSKESSTSAKPQSCSKDGPSSVGISRLSSTETGTTGLQRTSSTRLPPSSKPEGLGRAPSIRAPQSHTRQASTTATSTTQSKRSSVNLSRPTPLNTTLPHYGQSAPSPTSPTRPTARTQMPPPSKPAFSTYQQHFSPAKTALPKPPIPSLRPVKPATVVEEEVPISAELAKSQIELLQLSLLYQASARATREFGQSAKRKLGKKHMQLKKELEGIRGVEAEHDKIANLEALEAWCPDVSYLSESLQSLTNIHHELVILAQPGSRFNELIATFENWVSDAAPSSKTRQVVFINPLPDHWKHSHASVALKLRSLQREMAALPPAPEDIGTNEAPPSLTRLLDSCILFIDGMLRELEMMSRLEREILAQEKLRIKTAIDAVSLDELDRISANDWAPAWRRGV